MRTITFIDRYIPQYRQEFFSLMRLELEKRGMNLQLIYGEPSESEKSKRDNVDIEFGVKVKNRYFNVGKKEVVLQPIIKYIWNSDLVIIDQANRLLANYFLQLLYILHIKKVCFWGHGKNFQSKKNDAISEWLKRKMVRHVHWWFVYNDVSARIVQEAGFPLEKITNVQNAIDTVNLVKEAEKWDADKADALRKSMGIKPDSNIALFIGGMYPEKHLDFVIESCDLARQEIPDFELLMVGGGPDADIVIGAEKAKKWVHYIPPKFGDERIPYFLMSKALLMPFALGLVVLDSFALKTPVLTLHAHNHGPEINYLVDGYNGLFAVNETVESYANLIKLFYEDKNLQTKIRLGCQESALEYSIEKMVNRFVDGIEQALE